MKKICEIYDVSKDYGLQEHTLSIVVSDLDKPTLLKTFCSFADQFPSLMTNDEWQHFICVDKSYNRNESKHKMRGKRILFVQKRSSKFLMKMIRSAKY